MEKQIYPQLELIEYSKYGLPENAEQYLSDPALLDLLQPNPDTGAPNYVPENPQSLATFRRVLDQEISVDELNEDDPEYRLEVITSILYGLMHIPGGY